MTHASTADARTQVDRAAEALDLVSPAVSPAADADSGDMMAAFGL